MTIGPTPARIAKGLYIPVALNKEAQPPATPEKSSWGHQNHTIGRSGHAYHHLSKEIFEWKPAVRWRRQ
ncbi:hypothetical protein N7509_010286 [Penicillium cosmopolitanum]|uniref:Uncharacterized protein n=1 Tax=Penicillium cosmopolitanum TaxID=1131564 RepID=A0A9W9VRB3_9EURO|nr:uncharacterized protein N7509_010286 [Penicillium cosmopolitanum]KAJ5387745.1 hypothetical protein N7509_010286 [Penicillium cosmopolitanum]